MKVSLNIVKELTGLELPPVKELVARINSQLGGVEEVIDLKEKYEGAVVVRVVSVVDHENSDHLHVCKVDDGGVIADVERDEDGYVQVVCGAPNAHADMWAVWLPPRSTVPASFDDDEPFVLDVRKLRGVISSGMLAAGDELAINSDHDGIIELTEHDLPPVLGGHGLATGQSFAELFGLDDCIINIENKMFTHRPDCFGQIGVAREISAILRGLPTDETEDTRYQNLDWYWNTPTFATASELALTVKNDNPDNIPRFMAVAMDSVSVHASPLWLQCELVRMGSKAINNIVDITNYLMLMTGQPTHAYDYDKLHGATLCARQAVDGEKITLLNSKTYELTASDIVIADADRPVGLAGIMGGTDTEVTDQTTRIVLEVATFDMYALRKTSMRHGVFTDALARFNKGQSPLQNDRVMAQLMVLMTQYGGARQASDVRDVPGLSEQDPTSLHGEMSITTSFINDRLGSALTATQISQLLRRVNFAVTVSGDSLSITAPFWRTDIEIPEDIVEELGRLYGFDRLPRELPKRSSAPVSVNPVRSLKQRIRESLSRAGANEVLTYSFVHENVIKRADQDAVQALKLSNALSPDLQYFRLSVLPSLLDKVHMNIKLGYDELTLFEIGKSHQKNRIDKDDLPAETGEIAAIYARKNPGEGAPYYHMRRVVTKLAHDLGITLQFVPLSETHDLDTQLVAPFESRRSAIVKSRQGDVLGVIGELKPSVRKAFKLPDYTAAMNLLTDSLLVAARLQHRHYVPLSRYPSTSQDISIKAPVAATYQQIYHTAWHALVEHAEGITVAIEPVSIYRPEGESDIRTTTLHITFTHYDRTLTDADIKPIMDHIASVLLAEHGAERI